MRINYRSKGSTASYTFLTRLGILSVFLGCWHVTVV